MVEVKLHDIGEGMTEADINCYLVKAGDRVKADDPLVEVQTDKMTAEIPAPRSGVIKEILLEPGQTIKVGTTLLILEDEAGAGEKENAAAKEIAVGVNLLNRPVEGLVPDELAKRPGRVLASPFTRKIARENNVSLADINGSGPAGRITDHDVLEFIKLRDSEPGSLPEKDPAVEGGYSGRVSFAKLAAMQTETGSGQQIPNHSDAGFERQGANESKPGFEQQVPNHSEAGSEQRVPNLSESGSEKQAASLSESSSEKQAASLSQGGSEHASNAEPAGNTSQEIPFRGRRKQIAKKMAQSVYTIPHCTHFEEIDVTELIGFREELKAAGQSVSATAFFIKALSICLKEFPIFNAKLNEERETIQLISDHHIGIAVDTPEGLIVPVVRNAERKTLKEIHREMKDLTKRALEDKLEMKEIAGGTFTISNVGPLGGSIGATPIIQHPQTALVSFHKTKKRPVVNEHDEIVIRSIMNLSMSFDHRVSDGATAVAFTNRFAKLIENPKMLILELM